MNPYVNIPGTTRHTLSVDDEMRQMIMKNSDASMIKALAVEKVVEQNTGKFRGASAPKTTTVSGEKAMYLNYSPAKDVSSRVYFMVKNDKVYRTGDVANLDEDGYLTFVGRADDVFKSSDYRISPFELESVLIEHPAVAEAAVVPSPDPLRLAVPKAFIALRPGHAGDAATARSIFAFLRERLAPYKRVRRIEFAELPKTISGKIRRVDLREREAAARAAERTSAAEFVEEATREG
jgi:acyl-coenzyme A synthetase/AMP-(fatty) acid ligase